MVLLGGQMQSAQEARYAVFVALEFVITCHFILQSVPGLFAGYVLSH